MKSNKRHVYGLILVYLIGIGLLFFYRHWFLDVPLTDTETVNSWTVEANLHFIADLNTPVKASFIIPYMPPYFAILDEYFVSQNYGVTTNLNGYNRQTVWSLRRCSGRAIALLSRYFSRNDAQCESSLASHPLLSASP